MSLTRTRSRVRNGANQSIVDMLEEQLLECMSTNYKHTLRKALRAIRVFGEPILNKETALQVPGVGPHIATQIQFHLLEQLSQPPRPMPEPGAVLLPDQPEPSPAAAPRRRPRAQTSRARQYVPQYRSAAYGVLIALYHAESSGITAMRKDELARSAQQYCDKPVLAQASGDPSTWYSGWSSVNKTLVTKGLVTRGGNPIKFSLSATGRELAERLIDMDNGVLAMGTRQYRPDGPVKVDINNIPAVRRARTPTATGGASRTGAASVAAQNFDRGSRDQSQVLSQEESDLELARELARQFQEEDAAAAGRSVEQRQSEKSNRRPVSQPSVDPETASVLERKYRAGREFGAVASGVLPSAPRRSRAAPQPASQARRRKLTTLQCDRATKAIQRLEAGGFARADCIKVVEILHAEKALPRTPDGLYQAITNALWEVEKQDRRLGRGSEPIGLRISALGADSDDDDDIVGYEREAEDQVQHRDTPRPQNPMASSVLSPASAFRASSVGRVTCTPESCRPSKINSEDAVVVINLDDDSVLEIESPKASKLRTGPTSSNTAKRLRVADVIAIDSDDEVVVDTKHISTTVTPIEPTAKSAAVRQSPQRSNPPRESGSEGTKGDNRYSGRSPSPGERAADASIAGHGGLRTGGIHINQGVRPAQGEECRVILLLDSMERFRSSNTMAGHVKGPGDLLLEEGVDCEVRTLPTGDALFVARFPDESEVVLDYIIERKTIEDYESSMKDGRVARQSYLMRHANIKRRVFLLEGDLKDKEEIYNKTELHKKLAEMTMCSGLYVKNTRDIQDTVHFYASLYRRLQGKLWKQSKALTLQDRSLFSEWNERMNNMKKSLTLEQLFMIQLCQIPGVGTTKAQAIIDMGYTTPFLLYIAYKRLESEEEKDEMLNKGERAIGSAASKAVSQLFTRREYPTIVKPSPHK